MSDSTRTPPDRSDLAREIHALQWFHSLDFGDGLVSPGIAPVAALQSQARVFFGDNLAGKSVIDIGCWDGFYSVEAFNLGAARVLATDHWVWANHSWASRKTIELARKYLAPKLEIRDIDAPDLSPETVGTFDVVLFSDVLYHLRNPFAGLEKAARIVGETLVVETQLDALDISRPAAIFYPGTELNNDPSNWWGPNLACVEGMMRDVGFSHVRFTPIGVNRGIFHGTRRR